MRQVFKKRLEDSTTVMFAGKTTGIKSNLQNM